MAYYALLGGRSIPHLEDFTLEKKIFSYLKITPNKILFIPLAFYPNMKASIDRFHRLVKNTYEIEDVVNYEDEELLKKEIDSSDVIYFSGGCAEELIRLIKKYKIDSILKKYEKSNKLFLGISAGAILFSKAGMGDRYTYKDKGEIYNYQMVKGLGILPITICPHYDHEGLTCYNSEVKKYACDGYALEDDTAILFAKEIVFFKQNSRKSIYQFDSKNDYIMIPKYEVKK